MGLRDLYITMVYLSFVVVGLTAPFVFTLGYLWVDTFYPQYVTDILSDVPVSLIMALLALGAYIVADRRAPPRISAHMMLTLLFAGWCTLSLTWAEVPDAAWIKWNYAFKAVIFSVFMTMTIRSRVQIEAFLGVFMFALVLHMMPLGIKNMISGSSYGRELGVLRFNTLLLESSELAAVSIALIPFYLWVRRHSILMPKSRLRDIGCFGMIGIAILCAIGTYARTALVGFVVVGVFLFLQSRRKLVFALVAVALVIGFGATTSSSWNRRISTTSDYEDDSSAMGRILAWKWTLDYVSEHPLGGGFNSYLINKIALPVQPGQPEQFITGKAFHNSYFEVLGEQGYPGLAMFIAILLITFGYLWTVVRRTKNQPHLVWLHDLALAMGTSLLTLLACASFIGIGFQPVVWYLIALPVCLREYLRRVEELEKRAELPPYLRERTNVDPGMVPRPVH